MTGRKESNIQNSFISHLRQASRLQCQVPGCSEEFPNVPERIRQHLISKHSDYIKGKDLDVLISQIRKGPDPVGNSPGSAGPAQTSGGRSSISKAPMITDEAGPSSRRGRKSPMRHSANQQRHRSSTPPKRSRARPPTTANPHDSDFPPRSPLQGKLWNPEQVTSQPRLSKAPSPAKKVEPEEEREEDESSLRLIPPPETRPISQEQLVAEVKGIYAGLMMVESKCIEVDNAQSSQKDTKLNNEQWQALIALHRTLLHEHHDFFLASQHPSASPALKRLASKYAMPARMWRHGIHSFLELLRHRLPGSLEHMLTFIYLAYSMMALLYETVPAFEDTWIECLGDLGRYRMAIEDEDIRDREVWTSVSRQWYSNASGKAPTTGRLYHHLAILARPNALQQLFYYSKSLCVPIPFASTKESIMTLFEPILGVSSHPPTRMASVDVTFVKAHGILFSGKMAQDFQPVVDEFLRVLDGHIEQMGKRWIEAGYYMAISNCCALLSYGKEENMIMRSIQNQNREQHDDDLEVETDDSKLATDLKDALRLVMETHMVVLDRREDENVLPYIHVVMVFMFYLTRHPNVLRQLEHQFPWKLLELLLNKFLETYNDYDRMVGNDFPRENNCQPNPLPEDFALKGLVFVDQYYPHNWFKNERDDDEKYFEKASMANTRRERILWLGHNIAQSGTGINYDEAANCFRVSPACEIMEEIASHEAGISISDASHAETGDAMDIDKPPKPGLDTNAA